MSVNVKICGIRSIESALAAIDAGADFIGLNFVPTSKRKVSEETAAEIIGAVKGQVKIVGVFQNGEVKYVNETADALGLDFVQLHGAENTSYIEQMHKDVIKAVPLKEHTDVRALLAEMKALPVSFFLLDREVQGTGSMVSVQIAKQLAHEFKVFLAGGLTPESVAALVANARPFAVDVAGGIETDGKEDFAKIKQFVANAKGVTL